MAVRNPGAQTLAARRPAAQPRHLRAGAGLVDEDQPGRVEIGLAVEPGFTPLGDVGAVLLGRVRSFF
jgi:hypothetical protein